jgi:hypothetical protein
VFFYGETTSEGIGKNTREDELIFGSDYVAAIRTCRNCGVVAKKVTYGYFCGGVACR